MLGLRAFLLSSAALVASQVVTAGVGFVFWILGSRLFAQEDIGIASAIVSGMAMVGAVGALGLGTVLIYEIPRHPGREAGIVLASLAASGAVGFGLGILFVLVAPLLSPDLGRMNDTPLLPWVVAIGTSLTAASLVLDQALIGLLRSGTQLVRNVLAAVLRLALLAGAGFVAISSGSVAIVGAWVASILLSMVALAVYRRGTRGTPEPTADATPLVEFLRTRWASALRHHALNLGQQVPGWAMPIVAVTVLSARTNAGFFVAWQLVGFAWFVHAALSWMLYATATRDPASLPRWSRLTLELMFLASLAAAAGLWLLGPFVLRLFGAGYAEVGSDAFIALPLILFPGVIKSLYVTINRVETTVSRAAIVVAAGAVLEIAGAWVGASLDGVRGLGFGILVAMLFEVMLMLPSCVAALRGRVVAPQSVASAPVASGDVSSRPLPVGRGTPPS